MLWINYPNNPTTLTTTLEFYNQVVDFCRYHEIYILSDLAYAELYFDNRPPPSILEVPGAKDIAVEARCIATEGWEWAYQAKDMVERCDVRSQQCYDTVMAMSRNCKNENVRLTALEASHKDNQIMIAEQSRNLIRMQRPEIEIHNLRPDSTN